MQIQALALGAKCGGFGDNGFITSGSTASAASKPSSFSRQASAKVPMPLAVVARKLRRDWWMYSWNGCITNSAAGSRLLSGHELVEIQDRSRQGHPGGRLR